MTSALGYPDASATDPRGHNLPSRYLRCCRLKYGGGEYKVEINRRSNGSRLLDDGIANAVDVTEAIPAKQYLFEIASRAL